MLEPCLARSAASLKSPASSLPIGLPSSSDASAAAPIFERCWLPLPHLGDWMQAGQPSAQIPVNVIDDLVFEGTQTVIVTLTPAAPTYTVMPPSVATVNIADNDTAGFIVSAISGHTSENLTSATFTVKLQSQPTGDVTIPLASNNTAEGTTVQSSLTFTNANWNVAQTVTVAGVNDSVTDGPVGYQITLGPTASADGK